MRTVALVCALLACVAAQSLGEPDNWIYQHNQNLEFGVDYSIDLEGRVSIMLGEPNEVFMFESVEWNGDPNDPNNYVGPGDIAGISASVNAGSVTITIVGNINYNHGQDFGARDIGLIDLDATGVDGAIAAARISRYLGTLGPLEATRITGLFDADDVVNDSKLDYLSGDIHCKHMRNLTVSQGTSNLPQILIWEGHNDPNHVIWVNGSVGTLWVFA